MPFFSQQKPKKFHYKPIYLKEEHDQEEKLGFSDKMLDLWNRDSYKKLISSGTRRIYRLILFVACLILGIIKLLDYFNQH